MKAPLNIMKLIILTTLLFSVLKSTAQTDSTPQVKPASHNIFRKDQRATKLGIEMATYNESLAKKTKMADGYRLMLLNSNDRNYAFKMRNRMMQQFPEHKLYLTFVAPNIKLKMGNFTDKASAEKMKKQLEDLKFFNEDIYLVREPVEVKPVDKSTDTDEP